MAFFRRQDGKDRSWAIDSLPDWVSWTLDRSYLESQAEVDELARFLRAKAWSFRHDGKTRFAGVQMAWTIALSAILYLRAMRHREEVSVQPPSRWSLSGSPEWQGRAQTYSFALDGEALRAILHEFRCYTEDLVLSMPVTGLPPSLLYVGHLSREEYVLNQIRSVPCLFELFELVVKMVSRVQAIMRPSAAYHLSRFTERRRIRLVPFFRAGRYGSSRSSASLELPIKRRRPGAYSWLLSIIPACSSAQMAPREEAKPASPRFLSFP